MSNRQREAHGDSSVHRVPAVLQNTQADVDSEWFLCDDHSLLGSHRLARANGGAQNAPERDEPLQNPHESILANRRAIPYGSANTYTAVWFNARFNSGACAVTRPFVISPSPSEWGLNCIPVTAFVIVHKGYRAEKKTPVWDDFPPMNS